MADFKSIAKKLAQKKVESKSLQELLTPEQSDAVAFQGKRKVITGGQQAKGSTSDIKSLKDRLKDGAQESGAVTEDTSVKGTSDKFDQYTKTRTEIDPTTGQKKIFIESPAEVIDIDPGRKIFDLEKKDQPASQPERKPATHRETRAQATEKLLNDYKQARAQSAYRSNMASTRAGTLAISNPAAAQVYLQAKKGYINEPTEAIEGGYRTAQDSNKVQAQNINLAAQDELDDPNSEVSRAMRDVLKTQFGMTQLSDAITARAIQQLFPQIKVDTQRDTTVRGQDFKAESDERNRTVKQSEGDKTRGNQYAMNDARVKAGIGKVIIGGALAQDMATRKGASDSAQKVANSATIPNAFNGKSFLVTKDGIPPSQERAKQVQTLGMQAARYVSVLKQLEQLIQQAEGRPQFFDENWPTVKAKYAEAAQRNVKFNGNGVTNGPDLEQALRQIGDPASAINWLRGAGQQIIQNATKSAMDQYYIGADSMGFTQSNKPSSITQTMGTGGSQSSQKPVNPALASGANEAATRFGFAPVVGSNPTPAPAPSGKKFKYRMINGVMTKVSQ